MTVNSVENIEIIPTGEALGAEVRGLDLSQDMPDDVIEKVTEAWGEHLVLLYRDQDLTDEDIIKYSGYFGGHQAAGARQQRREIGMKDAGKGSPTDMRINYVSNLDDDGKPTQHNRGIGSHEIRWHSDNTYVEVPPTGTLLWAEIIPDDDSGNTMFCNQVLAYEDMPDDMKEVIEGKHMMHDGSRTTANLVHPHRTMPESQEEIDGPVHPIVRIHPLTGKRVLFLGRRWNYPSTYIVEMPGDDGEELMDQLWAHATQEKYVWSHSWRTKDILQWDNRAVMHRRTAVNPTQKRVLHRTLIKGDPVISAWENNAAAE
ncbi:MAG: hypothetical protein CMM48_05635 [Rhodospirillaceae bacterium]|nr:hypothetical protein [Rhodospirillaceae bacterium]HAA91142.1 hypothetical protein [Rhodospirillaceae bacterium]